MIRNRPRWGCHHVSPGWEPGDLDAGDLEGPLHPTSATLAPTECDGLVLKIDAF